MHCDTFFSDISMSAHYPQVTILNENLDMTTFIFDTMFKGKITMLRTEQSCNGQQLYFNDA